MSGLSPLSGTPSGGSSGVLITEGWNPNRKSRTAAVDSPPPVPPGGLLFILGEAGTGLLSSFHFRCRREGGCGSRTRIFPNHQRSGGGGHEWLCDYFLNSHHVYPCFVTNMSRV
jgi:hypothetical protein